MLIERSPITRVEDDHRHGHGISLVFEEQWQVARFHISQLDFCVHWYFSWPHPGIVNGGRMIRSLRAVAVVN
jgi:hypothetical protein